MDTIDKMRTTLQQHEDLLDEAFHAAKAAFVKHGFSPTDERVPGFALNYMDSYNQMIGFATQAPQNVVETNFIGTEDLIRELRARRKKREGTP